MAELLVLAKAGYTNPDPEKDRRGCYKKGDIVHVSDDGHEWGAKETLPSFVVVKVPGVSLAAALAYRDHWQIELAFSVVSADLATDSFVVSLSNTNTNVSTGEAGITRAQVEEYLNGWNLAVDSVSANSVVFSGTIYGALTSSAFWDAPLTNIVFSEVSYDPQTGVHIIEANYAATNLKPLQVAKRITSLGGTPISNASRVMTFSMTRALARTAFQDDVADKAREIWKRRRWGFTPAQVDNAIASGGVVTITAAQAQSLIKDSLA